MKANSILSRCWFVLMLVVAWPLHGAEVAATERHCLWKVEGPKTTVHLLGSVHFLKKEDYPLPPVVEQAFEKAQVVGFEINIQDAEDPQKQLSMLVKAKLPDGQSLEQQISPKIYAALSNHLKEAELPVAAFHDFRPWFVAVGLLGLELPKMGLDPEYGVDKHFFQRAQKAGKTIMAFETMEEQMNFFTEMSKEDDEAFLDSTLKDIAQVRKVVTDLVAAWRKGDVSKLAQLLHEAMTEHPRIYQRFVTDRNKRWIPELEKMLRGDRPGLVIVGAGHLVGKESVVELLEKKGYKITQQ